MQPARTAWIVALGVGVAVIVAAAPRAQACSCPAQGGGPIWPLDGADDVPIDTPLVFERYNLGGPADAVGYALFAADGRSVALVEHHRLEPAFLGCNARETLFLKPSAPLAPGQKYTFSAQPGRSERISLEPSATFTTVDRLALPEATANASLEYLLITPPDCTGPSCYALAEASITLDAKPAEPRFLRLRSAALDHGRNATVFRPEQPDFERKRQLSVTLPRVDRCIEAELYGVRGTVLWRVRRCEPDHCVRIDTATFNFCGGPPFSGIQADDIPSDSCRAPPTVDLLGASPGADARPPDCNLLAPGASVGPLLSTAWMAALGSLWRRRRRISGRKPASSHPASLPNSSSDP